MPVIEVPAARVLRDAVLALTTLMLLGCVNTPNRAPIEDRSPTPRASVAAASPAIVAPPAPDAPKPAGESGARPGYYAVKPGDTLIRIGLDNGQNWKDLVRWNNLENPNLIEVGQMLRVVPPGVDPGAATSRPVTTARVDTRPLDAKPAPIGAAASAAAPASAPTPVVAVTPPPAPSPAPAAREPDDDITWAWPASAAVAAPFDEARNKGLVFRGKPGDPVLAAADGRVVYAGSGLRGYGNLVILKHSPTYLTAYAHNQSLLVKDDQAVRRGQKIAEMGSTDADSVQLHFEIRKQGKPIDPARLLPPR